MAIFSAAGLFYILLFLKKLSLKAFFIIILSVIIFFSFQNYLQIYFHDYPIYSSDYWGWQYGPKEIMTYFLSHKDSYDDLYLSGEFNAPEIFLKFYDPERKCAAKCQIGNFQTNYNPSRRQLFTPTLDKLSQSSFKNSFYTYQIIYYPDKSPAFYIGEIHPSDSSSL